MANAARGRVSFQTGDVFEVCLPDGGFAYGRILLYMRRVSLRGGFKFPHWIASFEANSMLICLTKQRFGARQSKIDGLADFPTLPSELLMTRQIRDGTLPIVGNMPVRPQEIDFPEGVCGFQDDNHGAFSKGSFDRIIELDSASYTWWNSLSHVGPAFGLSPELVLQKVTEPDWLSKHSWLDLRAHPEREKVLSLVGLSPMMTYAQICDLFGLMAPAEMLKLSTGKC